MDHAGEHGAVNIYTGQIFMARIWAGGEHQRWMANLMTRRLSATMTLREFKNGYWYADDLKDFARRIGIPAATRLRKDELERAISAFLRTGTVGPPTKRALFKTGAKDLERGLSLKLRIEHYSSNRETKEFIVREARKIAPEIREKSGVWYRLNRWREDQVTNGHHPTYGNLVKRYVELNRMDRFDKIPYDCYINFVAEFLKAEKRGTRSGAIAAWGKLKSMDTPKNYASWVKARRTQGKGKR